MWDKPKRTLEHFQGHYANTNKALKKTGCTPWNTTHAHTHNIQGDTIRLHFTYTKHKDFKIQVLKFISSHQNSEREMKFRLQKEKLWIHGLRCSTPKGLNVMEISLWAQKDTN